MSGATTGSGTGTTEAPLPEGPHANGQTDSQPRSAPPPTTPAPAKKLSVLSALPIVALGLSLFSLYTSETARREVARIDVIKTEYALFQELAQLEIDHPATTHLFAVTEQIYDETVATVRHANTPQSEAELARLLVEERSVAHFLFVAYEQTFYVSRETQGGDARRATMAADDLTWFDDLMCNNPRLRWLWENGRLNQEFAQDLRDHFSSAVGNCPVTADATGPFVFERKGTL